MAAKVPRRRLGKTGIDLPVVGFGASPLGGVYQEPLDEDEGIKAVHEAFKSGINYFDTSPYYGDLRSERVLGRALKDLPREEIFVATKVGRYVSNTFDFSAERVTKSVHESLERLQVSYIDLIQTHDIEFGDLEQVINEALPALQKLKQAGVVRFVGITGLPLKVFRTALDRVEDGTVDAVLSYCHYCLNDSSLDGLIPYLEGKGVGIINASLLSMGLLTEQGPPPWHPAPEDVKAACKRAAEYAEAHGSNISRLAIKWALQQSSISSHLIGFSNPQQVYDNVDTAVSSITAEEEKILAHVLEILAPIHNITWPSGRPENN